jgi:hypothetical protein
MITLDGTTLKSPKAFTREFIYQKQDFTSINGKTMRDTSGRKEKFVFEFENLTKTQVDALMTIVAKNVAVALVYQGDGIANISKMCFPYIGSIEYNTGGINYLSSLELDLIV